MTEKIHRRDAENAEGAQRKESFSLRPLCVLRVSAVNSSYIPYPQWQIALVHPSSFLLAFHNTRAFLLALVVSFHLLPQILGEMFGCTLLAAYRIRLI